MFCLAGVLSINTPAGAEESADQKLVVSISTAVTGSADWDWTQARTAFIPSDTPTWITTMSRITAVE
jgi:hypothetical protein